MLTHFPAGSQSAPSPLDGSLPVQVVYNLRLGIKRGKPFHLAFSRRRSLAFSPQIPLCSLIIVERIR